MLIDAIAFLLAHKGFHSKWLAASHAPLSGDDRGSLKPLDLSFVADKWWPLVTGNKDRGAVVGRIDRRITGSPKEGVPFRDIAGVKEIEAHLVPMAMDVSSDVLAAENRGRKLAHSFVALELVSRKTE